MITFELIVINPKDRAPCSVVVEKLRKIYLKCRADVTYAAATGPWKPERGNREPISEPIARDSIKMGSPDRMFKRRQQRKAQFQSK